MQRMINLVFGKVNLKCLGTLEEKGWIGSDDSRPTNYIAKSPTTALDTTKQNLDTEFSNNHKIVTKVRGKGLLNAIVINDNEGSDIAWNICLNMAEKGLLAKPTHGNIIRFAPPLIINEEQLNNCVDIIISSLKEFKL